MAQAIKQRALRYVNLVSEIHRLRARRILEVGTYRGQHAEEMIRAAAMHREPSEVEYFGFDLFEPPPAHEHTTRTIPPDIETVLRRLEATGARIMLIKGDSRQTLPAVAPELGAVDLIFIDGGHSKETVLSDWNAVQPAIGSETVVIFDDYWNYPEGGCNGVVDSIDRARFEVQLLDPIDEFPRPYGSLRTQFARVTRKGCP